MNIKQRFTNDIVKHYGGKEMGTGQKEMLDKITSMQEQLSKIQMEYWLEYTNLTTVRFWIVFLMFLIPLVVLYFRIDRKNIFLLGFYGFNIHVWFSYINIWGVKQGYWEYPYELIPFIPGNLSLDAALIPALFMFVYQWCLHRNKDINLYSVALIVFLAFVFKPILIAVGLFGVNKGLHSIHIFILYCIMYIISRLITSIFIWMHKSSK
jgi:hypothetical protein